MTDLDLPALKAAALAAIDKRPPIPRDYNPRAEEEHEAARFRLSALANPAAVLALIERLERAEAANRLKRPDTLTVGQTFWTEDNGVRTSPVLVVVEQSRLDKLEAVAKAAREWLGPMRHSHGFSEFRARCGECRLRDDLAALEAP